MVTIKNKSFASEEAEQMALIRWCQYHPELRNYMFHVPNGGFRNVIEGVKFSRLGVKQGVPDLWYPVPKKSYHGLVIELKRMDRKNTKNGGLTPTQKWWIENLNEMGYLAVVAYGFEEAVSVIKNYIED